MKKPIIWILLLVAWALVFFNRPFGEINSVVGWVIGSVILIFFLRSFLDRPRSALRLMEEGVGYKVLRVKYDSPQNTLWFKIKPGYKPIWAFFDSARVYRKGKPHEEVMISVGDTVYLQRGRGENGFEGWRLSVEPSVHSIEISDSGSMARILPLSSINNA